MPLPLGEILFTKFSQLVGNLPEIHLVSLFDVAIASLTLVCNVSMLGNSKSAHLGESAVPPYMGRPAISQPAVCEFM